MGGSAREGLANSALDCVSIDQSDFTGALCTNSIHGLVVAVHVVLWRCVGYRAMGRWSRGKALSSHCSNSGTFTGVWTQPHQASPSQGGGRSSEVA